MSLQQKLNNDLKQAMRDKDELRLSVLRMAVSALKNRSIEKRGKGLEETLTEEEIIAVMRSEVKKRHDAIVEYKKGNRPKLAQKEKEEMAILEQYLPAEMSDEEIEKIVKEVVTGIGDITPKGFGKVMGEAMKRVKGQASGDRVNIVVKKMMGI